MLSRAYGHYRQDYRTRLIADHLVVIDQSETGNCGLPFPDDCLAPWRVVKSRNSICTFDQTTTQHFCFTVGQLHILSDTTLPCYRVRPEIVDSRDRIIR